MGGNQQAQQEIQSALKTLAELYPAHIAKEDERFFPASIRYFSAEEQKGLSEKFDDFDRNFTCKRFTKIVSDWENNSG